MVTPSANTHSDRPYGTRAKSRGGNPPAPALNWPGFAAFGVAASAIAFYAAFIFRTSFRARGERVFVLFEDAMISMRYARNLAEHNGLVWNAGEAPVEGYTNFLWTLVMSAVHKAGCADAAASLAMMTLGAGLLLGCGAVAAQTAWMLSRSAWAPLAAAAATLFAFPLVFWTLRGMEVGALALTLSALVLVAMRLGERPSNGRLLAMAALAALAVLLRSDAVVALTVIFGYGLAVTRGQKRVLFIAYYGGAIGLSMSGHAVFRLWMYGDVVPNTFYLKLLHVGLAARLKRGIFVTAQVASFHLLIPLAVLAAAVPVKRLPAMAWAALRDPQAVKVRRVALLLGVVAGQLAYAIYVGGDAWEWTLFANRYLSVVLPSLVVLTIVAVDALLHIRADEGPSRVGVFAAAVTVLAVVLLTTQAYALRWPEAGVARTIVFSKTASLAGLAFLAFGIVLGRAPVAANVSSAVARVRAGLSKSPGAIAVLVAFVVWAPAHAHGYAHWIMHNAPQYTDEERYARLGILIAASTRPETRVAVVAAGATPYFARRPSEDMLGKSDPVIAKRRPSGTFSPGHDKWDYRWSIGEKRPDIIVELVDATDADQAYIAGLGYETLANGLRVKSADSKVDCDVLGLPYKSEGELDVALKVDARVARILASQGSP